MNFFKPRRARRASWQTLVLVLLPLLLASPSSARTLGAAFNYAGGLEPELQLRDLSVEGLGVDLRLAGGLTTPPEGGAVARFRSSFGPLGTVALAGRADLGATGSFDLGLSGSGTLASTGFSGAVGLFNRNPGAFSPTGAYDLSARPFVSPVPLAGGVGAHLELGVTRRVGRTVILEANPALTYLSGVGLGERLEGTLQFRRLVGNDNGAALLLAARSPEGDGFGAAGFEYRVSRADTPLLSGALLLGVGSGGVAPGLRVSVSSSTTASTVASTTANAAPSVSYRAALSAEPYRSDVPPYRGSAGFSTPLGNGVVGLELGATLANRFGVPPVLLRTSYAVGF